MSNLPHQTPEPTLLTNSHTTLPELPMEQVFISIVLLDSGTHFHLI